MTPGAALPGAGADARDLVMRFVEALNDQAGTTSALERFSGSEALTSKVMDYRGAYPNFRIHPLDVFSERDLVVVRFILDLEARLPADRSVTDMPPDLLEAVAVCRVAGGAITEVWFEMDVFAQVLAVSEGSQGQQIATATEHGQNSDQPAAAPDSEVNRALVLRYLAALNNQRKTPELIGRFATDRALSDHVMAFEAGFPGYSLLADDIIADGDRVAVRFHTRQRHAGEFMGIPATGQELSMSGIIIYRVEGGKIADHWLQADTWTLMQRLQDGAGPLTKRQFIDRRMRGGEHDGAERRQATSTPSSV